MPICSIRFSALGVRGHTELVYVAAPGDYRIVGETRDDAVGEAYDKVGRVMGLTYPAGKEIDQLAHQGQDIYDFPRAMIKRRQFGIFLSGLKSAFINLHHNARQKGEQLRLEDLCASFQAAVLDILMVKKKGFGSLSCKNFGYCWRCGS